MAKFSKLLSKTDVTKRLSLPAKYLKSLPPLKGAYAVTFQAIDEEGQVWAFTCTVRKKGQYLKPVISKGWLAFVGSKKLKIGDRITFCKVKNKVSVTHVNYKVQTEKAIKVFGAVFGYTAV